MDAPEGVHSKTLWVCRSCPPSLGKATVFPLVKGTKDVSPPQDNSCPQPTPDTNPHLFSCLLG